jgi:hypothetical protein
VAGLLNRLVGTTVASSAKTGPLASAACFKLQPFLVGRGLSSQTPTNVPRTPTFEDAKNMPREFSEMSNDSLLVYASKGNHDACRERLLREIMFVDKVSWDKAHLRLDEMEIANKQYMSIATLPFKIGVLTSLTAGIASFPLCFSETATKWFNDNYVTADVADSKDLETWLEVGSWSWHWMEPPLGQISFLLLCLAFARNQLVNLRESPYTFRLQEFRLKRLLKLYPQYSPMIVEEFADSDEWK